MVQKVISGSIAVENVTIASIGVGLFVLVGFYRDDTDKEIDYLVRRLLRLRLFPDGDDRRWQLNIMDKDYEILCMSQITLYYSIKGNKIDFHTAMHPNNSRAFYERFITKLRSAYKLEKVQCIRPKVCYSYGTTHITPWLTYKSAV